MKARPVLCEPTIGGCHGCAVCSRAAPDTHGCTRRSRGTPHHTFDRVLGLAVAVAVAVAAMALTSGTARAEPPGPTLPPMMTPEISKTIERGLGFLAKAQTADGQFPAAGSMGVYPAVMTSLAGLTFLASGSTPEEGPYAPNVKKAMLYTLRVADAGKEDGLIAGPGSESRSMYGHGFSMLFLAQCYGMELNMPLEERIRGALERGIACTVKAQSGAGGWIYTPSGQGDEGSVTVTQLQALRACRNVGIKVPKDCIDRGVKYLKMCQNGDGGISYSAMSRGSSRPAISAAAVACFYAAGLYDRTTGGMGEEAEMVEKLVTYVKRSAMPNGGGGEGYYFYTHMYMAEAMYQRGGRDWEAYYPQIAERLLKMQGQEGSWDGDGVGTTYGTAIATLILQLPYGYLPIVQR